MKLCHSFASLAGITLQVLLFSGTSTLVSGFPTDHPFTDTWNNETNTWGLSDSALEDGIIFDKRQAKQTPLRIMALGASIVYGVGSSHANGFRQHIRQQLRSEGHEVDMVGTKKGGSMKDNDCEATSGYTVEQIHEASRLSYRFKPNVVLINAGTNDIVGNVDPDNQHIRLRNMIQALWDNISPGTVVVVSTILPLGPADQEARRKRVNENYRNVVRQFYANGRPCFLAEMDGHVSFSDLPDAVHPNDYGFQKMAGSFWAAIKRAKDQGRIPEPLPNADLETSMPGCKKVPGKGVNAGALTQVGSGHDDGEYQHDSIAKGVVMTITSDWDRDQWFFARIFRSDRDDLLGWIKNSAGNVVYAVRRNDGGGKFTQLTVDLDVKDNCIQRGVVFVDLNGDGLDDFACIGPDGAIFASINNGNNGGGVPPTFTHIGVWKASNPRYPQARVRLADVDGDGRADFIGLEPNGDAYMWRNGGLGNKPEYFQALGKRFSGKGMGNLDGTRFEDINGDGRDDWIWVGDKGETHMWSNSRSCGWGVVGDGLNIAWRIGTNKATGRAPTHNGGMGSDIRNRIHFARIFGEPQAFGLLGRQDYVYMDHKKLSNGKHEFKVTVWQNNGYGSTKLKADGNRYCDMTGNGRDDYVWIWSGGDMDLFENAGRDFINGGISFWKQPPSPSIFKPGRLLDRRDLHLVDFDGDGKCDILWTDPNNQNRVQMWRNRYTPGGGFNWEFVGNPAPTLYCPEKRGLGIFDLPVRFADITGSGRPDYLCIERSGRVWGWTQDGLGGWSYMDQIKSAKGHDRANLRWADVNGDGRADTIWLDKFTGDGLVYYNLGRQDIGGSRFHWEGPPARAYAGSFQGSCQYFPDLNGDGRADLHSIDGTWTNKAHTAYNLCGMNNIGDDGSPSTKPPLVMPPAGLPIEGTPGGGNNGGGGAQPIEEGWRKVQCTDDGVKDASRSGEYRWLKVLSGPAFSAAEKNWKEKHRPGKTFSFVRSISNFFNGPENMQCETLTADNGCHGGNNLQCHDTNAPAGYFILNSFRQISAVTWNTFSALGEAHTSVSNKIGTLTETFSPVEKEDISLNIMIDIVTLGYGAGMAPTWNKWLKNVPWSKGNSDDYGTLKDFTNDMVKGGFTLTKDLLTKDTSLGSQNTLSDNVKTIITMWKDSLEDYVETLFNGEDDNLYRLGRLMENGKLMDPNIDLPSINDVKKDFEKIMYGLLIPMAWAVSSDDINPFVLDTGLSCNSADNNDDLKRRLTPAAMQYGKVCVNGKAFYLIAARNPSQRCKTSSTRGDYCEDFDLPPGTRALGAAWGELTITDIVDGTINTFKKHGGNQVNPQLPGELRDNQIEDMADLQIRSPYFFNIPICDLNTAVWGYWYGRRDNNKKMHFPCDAKYDLL